MNKLFTLGLVFGVIFCLFGGIYTFSTTTKAVAATVQMDAGLPIFEITDSTVSVGEITQVVPELAPVMVEVEMPKVTIKAHKTEQFKVVIGESVVKNCYDYGMYASGQDTVRICE